LCVGSCLFVRSPGSTTTDYSSRSWAGTSSPRRGPLLKRWARPVNLALAFLIFSGAARGTPAPTDPPNRSLTRARLRQDLDILRGTFEKASQLIEGQGCGSPSALTACGPPWGVPQRSILSTASSAPGGLAAAASESHCARAFRASNIGRSDILAFSIGENMHRAPPGLPRGRPPPASRSLQPSGR
jgi:hypothetical protein